MAAYERELIVLVQVVRHWRPYLWGRAFTVCTDHYSLKFILDQPISTVPQHQWVSKLIGYDFTVEYRPGRLKTTADALSRCDSDDSLVTVCAISAASQFALFDDLSKEIATSTKLSLHRRHAYVFPSSPLVASLLEQAHAAHEGIQKTLHRLRDTIHIGARVGMFLQDLSTEHD